jgi:hypothetical protein
MYGNIVMIIYHLLSKSVALQTNRLHHGNHVHYINLHDTDMVLAVLERKNVGESKAGIDFWV